jgi:peptidoglycan/xylan/chitin deacetylase (PgdA/CDA1 family)
MKQLSDLGVIFGSHGLSHSLLTEMSLSEIANELTESKKQIEAIIGQTVDLLSFPFGRYNAPVCRAAKESGYQHAMILGERRGIEEQDDFILPRTAIYGFDDYYSLRRKIFQATPFERTKRAIVGRLAGGTITFKSRLK